LAKMRYPKVLCSEIDTLELKEIVFQAENFILMGFFDSEDNEPFGSQSYMGMNFISLEIPGM